MNIIARLEYKLTYYEPQLHNLEQAAGGISLHVNSNKTEYMCIKREGAISTLSDEPLKLVDRFTYLSSSVSSTESDVNICLVKAWTAIDKPIIWKPNPSNRLKRELFQAMAMPIHLYGCTTWTLTKRIKKTLEGNYTRMLWSILKKSRKQHPTKQQLYGHLPPISKPFK